MFRFRRRYISSNLTPTFLLFEITLNVTALYLRLFNLFIAKSFKMKIFKMAKNLPCEWIALSTYLILICIRL